MMRHKPMLAHPVSDRPVDYDSGPVFIQPKLDGVRCLIQYDNSTVTAYSRTGKEWKNIDHILFNLKSFFQLNPDVVLDGELYNHKLKDDFEKIISCVRKTKPTDEHRRESERLVQFHCYDIIKPSSRGMTFSEREEWLRLNVPKHNYVVRQVESTIVRNEVDAQHENNANLAEGYEGSILRTNDIYQHKRSHSLRKFKQFHDAEAKIIGWVAGKGKRIGTIGKFMAIDDDGNTFGMPVMDKQKYLEENFERCKAG